MYLVGPAGVVSDTSLTDRDSLAVYLVGPAGVVSDTSLTDRYSLAMYLVGPASVVSDTAYYQVQIHVVCVFKWFSIVKGL